MFFRVEFGEISPKRFLALGKLIGIKIAPWMTFESAAVSGLIGFAVPILSAIIPIRTALSVHLMEALSPT